MIQDKQIYILDTSALLTYIEDEEGAADVENFLIKAERGEVEIYISFISLTEIFYISIQEKGETATLQRIELIQSLTVQVVESYKDLNMKAGKLKATNRISLADSFIAALCRDYNGILVHKDPEFEKMSPSLEAYQLPYK
ncbi:MAG: type II toxin-antitoxin system VapC family toxin [Acidobacteria bacterium]|nr:type II toxin-antitoxin system VapC family toxin [Acidobacteriota bacterium]